MNKHLTFTIFWLFALIAGAQNSGQQASEDRSYDLIRDLIAEKSWTLAHQRATDFAEQFPQSDELEEVKYLQVLSGLNGFLPSSTALADDYLDNRAPGVRTDLIRMAWADQLFAQKKYEKASDLYEGITRQFVAQKDYIRAQYFVAYCSYAAGDRDKALTKFKEVTLYQDEYRIKSAYYAGTILYEQKSFEEALRYLLIADEENPLQLSGMIANVYFQLNRRDDLVAYAKQKIEKSNRATKIALYRLLGEVYFDQRNFELAADNFQRSIDLAKKGVEVSTYYKLAFSYDQLHQSDKAIDNYKIAALKNSEIGQLSAFRLGELYVNQEDYNFAAQSFEQASRFDFNTEIKEQSTFLPGKLKLKIGNFDEAITDLEQYLEDYPDASWQSEATDLLAEAYLRTSNYEKAIAHIESLPRQTSVTRTAYQQVTLRKGQQLFNETKFERSRRFLSKSLRYTPNPELVAQAHYWMAESYVASEDPAAAKRAYQSVLNLGGGREVRLLKGLSHYGLGYIAYNEKAYQRAANAFQAYLSTVDLKHAYYQDAQLRLADCQYALKEFDQARSGYETLLHGDYPRKDYLRYQLGLVAYQREDLAEAELQLRFVIQDYPNSVLADNAAFQNGQMWFENADFASAIRTFSIVIERYGSSGLLPYALVRRGVCEANLEELEKAEEDFARVIAEFPNHVAAGDAIIGLQDLQKRGVEVASFSELLAQYKQANPDNSSLESIDFEQIKTNYFNRKYAQLGFLVDQFVKDYPESNFLPDAYYYLADGYYRSFDYVQAVTQFNRLLVYPNYDYYQRVLDKRGKSLLKLERGREAVQNYQLLSGAARNPREKYLAREGLMNAFQAIDADSAIYFADEILTANWKPINGEHLAQLTKLRLFMTQDRIAEAKAIADQLRQESSDEVGAEAAYQYSFIQAEEEDFAGSNQSIFQLLNEFASYANWTDRGYLLLIDNYIALNELLQAEATANSILEKSTNEALKLEAATKQEQIKALELELLQQEQDSTEQVINEADSIK
ncbi:MAG: tetratricopeptide repeat protein [Cytophagales bacterium]|nr:tetratricopeptide repeat protein [Cytophagales bacterium]